MATISRRTAISLAKVYSGSFASRSYRGDILVSLAVNSRLLHEFLFEHHVPDLFLQKAKQWSIPSDLEDYIMHFHDGKSAWDLKEDRTKVQNQHTLEAEGQEWLLKLSRWILPEFSEGLANSPDFYRHQKIVAMRDSLVRSLELDGYTWEQGRIIELESDILEAKEERGLIRQLFSGLALGNKAILDQDLDSSEEHYFNGKWDDCISNARQVLDLIMKEIAKDAPRILKGVTALPENDFKRPAAVREYLEKIDLVSLDEMKAIKESYGFMSNTGSHPYIAGQDQARMARRIALVFSEFLLLRYRGKIAANS